MKLWRSKNEFSYCQIKEVTVIKLSTRYNEDRLLVHFNSGKIGKFYFRGINEMNIYAMLEELSKIGFPITYLKGYFRDPEKITFNYKKN